MMIQIFLSPLKMRAINNICQRNYIQVGGWMINNENLGLEEIFNDAIEKNKDDIVLVSDILSQDDVLEKKIINEISENEDIKDSYTGDNALYSYVNQVSKIKLLTKEEELELGRKYFEEKDINARNKLIEANLRLVMKNAMRFKGRGIDMLDLIQEGNVGLTKAADKFDYRKGYRFTTYATWWVLQGIRQMVIQGKSNMISVPGYIQRKQKTIETFTNNFVDEYKREPTLKEISEATGFSERVIKNILSAPSAVLTLDARVNNDTDDTFADFAVDVDALSTENIVEREFIQNSINECIDKMLSEREKYVVKLYYGFGGNEKCSLQEIGDRLNLTRERVRQIKSEALQKLNELTDVDLEQLI